jgi:hypothetical protein
LTHTFLQSLALNLLERLRIGPGQTRIIPVAIDQNDIFTEPSIELDIKMSSLDGANVKLPVSLKLNHVVQWDDMQYKPLISSYLYADSTPTAFVSIPPKRNQRNIHSPPLLILRASCRYACTLYDLLQNLWNRWCRCQCSDKSFLGMFSTQTRVQLDNHAHW